MSGIKYITTMLVIATLLPSCKSKEKMVQPKDKAKYITFICTIPKSQDEELKMVLRPKCKCTKPNCDCTKQDCKH